MFPRRSQVPARILVAFVITLFGASPALSQRWGEDADGAETCRAIWREFGRTMSGEPRAVFCEVREIGILPRTETISVDGGAKNGVRVRGEQRQDARVRLVIQAQGRTVDEARDLARKVTLDLTQSPLRVAGIDREDTRGERRFVAATIAVDVPQRSNLALRVSYAPLDVENVTGQLDLQAEHGPLTMRDVGGDVRARVEYGPITVDLSAAKWQGTGLDAEAEYGPVTLRVPPNFGAELEIGTKHGPLDIDFPITLRRFNGSTISTTLGSGGPRVRAIALYGPMSLKMNRSADR